MEDTKKDWYTKWWGILIIFILALVIIITTALALTFLNYSKQFKDNPLLVNTIIPNQEGIDIKIIEGENSYWLGSANPKVTIVEFGDFSCPACKNSFSVLREISIKHKNEVKIIFRDFPVVSEHSLNLSLAGRCAGEQGFFWPMYDKLFLNQGISTDNEIKNIFSQIGGNTEKFETCFKSKKYLKDIQKDLEDATTLNLKGTPGWFINGNNINGDIPREAFLDLIEKILKAS